MLSLGREPQEPEIRKYSSPRRGRQICYVAHAVGITAIYLSPLRGFLSFFHPYPGAHAPGYVFFAAPRLAR